MQDTEYGRRREFQKEKKCQTMKYLDLLSHYKARLIRADGAIKIVTGKTGAPLPFEKKAERLMIRQLLEEFGTIDGTNQAVKGYKS